MRAQAALWAEPVAQSAPVAKPPAWERWQLNDWYSRRSAFERELYAYFLEVAKAEAGIEPASESLHCASTAAALTMRNTTIRREKGLVK